MNAKRIGITPSQVVSFTLVTSTAVLAALQGNNAIHTPAWVYVILAVLISMCRSILSQNNGGANDVKAIAVHSTDGGAG